MHIEIQGIKRYMLMSIICRLGYEVQNSEILTHKFQLKLNLYTGVFEYISQILL